jgi:hypothetical protein
MLQKVFKLLCILVLISESFCEIGAYKNLMKGFGIPRRDGRGINKLKIKLCLYKMF